MLNDNPVAELEGYRLAALGTFPRLTELDSAPVPQREDAEQDETLACRGDSS